MVHRWVDRLAAMCAAAVALLSVVYAVAYLVITPAAQRGSHSDRFFRSYLAHPAGLRVASACLAASGLAGAVALVALASRLGAVPRPWLGWVSMAAVVAGFATSAHGLGDLLGVDRLAHQYAVGDGATRAAAAVSRAIPAPTDPRGLATFAVAGLVAIVFGATLRPSRGWFGTLGVVLGIDMVVLFAATAVGITRSFCSAGPWHRLSSDPCGGPASRESCGPPMGSPTQPRPPPRRPSPRPWRRAASRPGPGPEVQRSIQRRSGTAGPHPGWTDVGDVYFLGVGPRDRLAHPPATLHRYTAADAGP